MDELNDFQKEFLEFRLECLRHDNNVEKRIKSSFSTFRFKKNRITQVILNEKAALSKRFEDYVKKSDESNLYFSFCSLNVYKSHYSERLLEYLENTIDANEIDFIEHEVSTIYTSNELASAIYKNNNTLSLNKKIQFLDTKKTEILIKRNSKSKTLSALLTVRLLDHFDILEFLLQQGHTSNKIAKIIADLQGKHYKNISTEISRRSRPMTSKSLKGNLERIINEIDKL